MSCLSDDRCAYLRLFTKIEHSPFVKLKRRLAESTLLRARHKLLEMLCWREELMDEYDVLLSMTNDRIDLWKYFQKGREYSWSGKPLCESYSEYFLKDLRSAPDPMAEVGMQAACMHEALCILLGDGQGERLLKKYTAAYHVANGGACLYRKRFFAAGYQYG